MSNLLDFDSLGMIWPLLVAVVFPCRSWLDLHSLVRGDSAAPLQSLGAVEARSAATQGVEIMINWVLLPTFERWKSSNESSWIMIHDYPQYLGYNVWYPSPSSQIQPGFSGGKPAGACLLQRGWSMNWDSEEHFIHFNQLDVFFSSRNSCESSVRLPSGELSETKSCYMHILCWHRYILYMIWADTDVFLITVATRDVFLILLPQANLIQTCCEWQWLWTFLDSTEMFQEATNYVVLWFIFQRVPTCYYVS